MRKNKKIIFLNVALIDAILKKSILI